MSAVCLALLAGGCAGADDSADRTNESATVAIVSDGDSLRLSDGRRVRLLQIDAPERGECHYAAAARALARLAPPTSAIRLEADDRLDDRDEHGRLLRYATAKGRNLNLELVRLGAAAPYFFRGERGLYANELLDGARAARALGQGLWGACPGARLEPRLGAVTGRP